MKIKDDTNNPHRAYRILSELYEAYVDVRKDAKSAAALMEADDFNLNHLDEMLTKIGSNLFTAHKQAHDLYFDDLRSMYNAQTKANIMAETQTESLTDDYKAAVQAVQSTSNATKQSHRETHQIEIDLLEFEQACTSLPDYMLDVAEEILAELYTLYPLHNKRDPELFHSHLTGLGTGLLMSPPSDIDLH